ncbi:nicotinate-nucleotide adenylyltransferase [bacterium]|nr:nicotinate-nucleotide adenylyltransferase [bacterium]
MAESVKRIGVFGGSFDPPHIGHFHSVRIAAEQLDLKKILIIPAAIQPHKPSGSIASDELRCKMIEALIHSDPLFELCRFEIERGGVSYTVDTLKLLTEQYPNPPNKLYLLVGSDTLSEMDSWREPDTVFQLAKVVVMSRPGNNVNSISSHWALEAQSVNIPRLEISSTDIRKRIAKGLPVELLTGKAVNQIIIENGLYS